MERFALAALLLAAAAAGLDAGRRARARDRDDALHRRSAALVGPELALRRSSAAARHPGRGGRGASLRAGPGVADTDPRALGALER